MEQIEGVTDPEHEGKPISGRPDCRRGHTQLVGRAVLARRRAGGGSPGAARARGLADAPRRCTPAERLGREGCPRGGGSRLRGHGDALSLEGVGCPLGALLAGPAAALERAWREKHLFGGAMRQAGIVAAAGVYALEHHVERLAEDHARARRLADGWHEAGLPVDLEQVETNFVQLDLGGARSGRDEAIVRAPRGRRRAVLDDPADGDPRGDAPRSRRRRRRAGVELAPRALGAVSAPEGPS